MNKNILVRAQVLSAAIINGDKVANEGANPVYGALLKAFKVNGHNLETPIFLDEKMSQERLNAYADQGFAPGAVVDFTCQGINGESHREMKATETLPARALHAIIGPMTNLEVVRGVKPISFAAASDKATENVPKPSLLGSVMDSLGLTKAPAKKTAARK